MSNHRSLNLGSAIHALLAGISFDMPPLPPMANVMQAKSRKGKHWTIYPDPAKLRYEQNRYTGADLRKIRFNQTCDAIDAHHAAGGEPIDVETCIDLHQ